MKRLTSNAILAMRKKFIYEPAKRIQVADNVDVAVAGGGPAGIGATIGAVRVGARVAFDLYRKSVQDKPFLL